MSDKTVTAHEKAQEEGKSHWRVSSTLFANFRSDVICEPISELNHLFSADAISRYPRRTAEDILLTELQATSMMSEKETERFEAKVVYNQYDGDDASKPSAKEEIEI